MKFIYSSVLVLLMLLVSSSVSNAQMMENQSSVSSGSGTGIQEQQQEELQGKDIFDKLKNKTISCKDVKDSDFEKIGEYVMSGMFNGNTAGHIQMNERIKSMRGDSGEEQVHIQIGKNASGCEPSSDGIFKRGGGGHMMGWNGYNMMYGSASFGVFPYIVHIVLIIDLVLAGVWLFQQITSHKRK